MANPYLIEWGMNGVTVQLLYTHYTIQPMQLVVCVLRAHEETGSEKVSPLPKMTQLVSGVQVCLTL